MIKILCALVPCLLPRAAGDESAGVAADTREDEHDRTHYDQFVFFGSSGGGEYFGLGSTLTGQYR